MINGVAIHKDCESYSAKCEQLKPAENRLQKCSGRRNDAVIKQNTDKPKHECQISNIQCKVLLWTVISHQTCCICCSMVHHHRCAILKLHPENGHCVIKMHMFVHTNLPMWKATTRRYCWAGMFWLN